MSYVIVNSASDITLRLGSLLLDLGGGDQIHIENFNNDDAYNSVVIDSFQFADGSSLTSSELLARGFDLGGTEQEDILTGTNITDRISGFGGDDLLVGRAGDDAVMGGDGDDELFGDDMVTLLDAALHGNDFIDGEGGSDKILGNGGADTLHGGVGNDQIWGDGGWPISDVNYLISQYHGSDSINAGEGDDYVQGDGGDDTIYGGSGADTLWGDADESSLIEEFHGNDYLDGGEGSDALYGGSGNDTLIGGAGNDLLDGAEGDDIMVAGAGDRVEDEKGSNTLTLADGEPVTVTTIGADLVLSYSAGNLVVKDGLRGSMAIIAGQSAATWVQEHVTGDLNVASTQSDQTLLGGGGNDVLNARHGNATLIGGTGNDQLYGSEGDDFLIGGGGTNTLYAGAGNDILTSGGQADYLDGGEGDNIYRVTHEAGRVNIASRFGLGSDTLLLSGSPETTIVKTSRTEDDLILTTFTLALDAGGNELQLEGPVVTVVGYFYPQQDETSNTFGGIRFEDATFVSVQQLLEDAATGTQGDDSLYGSLGADVLVAFGGSDKLYGLSGDDRLEGGTGHDVLDGAQGSDSLHGGDGDDALNGGAGDDLLDAGEGADLLAGGEGDDLLSAGVGDDSLDGGVGDDTLCGDAGNDVLQGGEGNDVLSGGDGDDVLYAGKGNDTLNGGVGMDTYMLGYGMDQVKVIDGSSEGSVIQLDSSGLELRNLAARRVSDDLYVEVRGTDSAMCIKDYYSATQTSWTLKDAGGNVQSIQALIDASTPQWGSLRSSLFQEFRVRAEGAIGETYAAQGYTRQVDGTWFKPSSVAYGGLSFYNTSTQVTTLTNRVHVAVEDISNVWQTSSTVVSDPVWNLGQWLQQNIATEETTVSIGNQTTVISSEFASLNPLSSNSTYLQRWSAVSWSNTQSSTHESGWSMPYTYHWPQGTPDQVITEWKKTTSAYRHYVGSGGALTAQNPGAQTLAGPLPDFVAVELTRVNLSYNLGEATLADGDHVVIANQHSAVVGGTGNNEIYYAGFAYGGTGNARLIGGDILMAGSGDQYLEDGQTMVVGDGHTTVVGKASGYTEEIPYLGNYVKGRYVQPGTRILIDPNNTGIDLLVSDDDSRTDRNNDWVDDSIEGIYRSQGIRNARESYAYGGKFFVGAEESYGDYYDTEEEGRRAFTERYGSSGYVSYYVQPLAVLLRTPTYELELFEEPSSYYATHPLPTVSLVANDFAALQSYLDSGALPLKMVNFGQGLSLSDITLSWGTAISPLDGSEHVTLDLHWGVDQGVQVMIPRSGDPLNGTVGQFEFADGQVISLGSLIALAPPAPSFDIGFTQFYAGMGQQTVAADLLQGIDAASTAAADILVVSDGVDLVISTSNGQDSLRLTGWYTDRDNYSDILVTLSNSAFMSSQGLDDIGLLKDGSAGNMTLYGVPDFGTTFIAGPNTTLIGQSGNDTYVFNAGSGLVHITDPGGGTLRFGTGITSDMVSLSLGSLLLTIGDQGDAIHLDGFDPADAENFLSVQNFEFADGSELEFYELLERGFDIRGTSGEDTLTGTSVTDRFYASEGNDTLLGGIGDDIYQITGAGDVVVELADEGYDWLESSVTIATPDNVEGILLTGDDHINATGNDLHNELYGNSGDNILSGGAGGDVLRGGAGNDTAIGGSGDDEYVYGAGDGHDILVEDDSTEGSTDSLVFDAGISASNVAVTRYGQDLVLGYGATDSITVKNWFVSTDHKIEQVYFDDEEVTVWDSAQLEAMAEAALAVINPIESQSTLEDSVWSFVLPEDTFAGANSSNSSALNLSVSLGNGDALPNWLSFDAVTRTFSGTPGNADVGGLSLKVTATDGPNASVSSTFSVTIGNVNDAPTVTNTITSQEVDEDTAWSYTVPSGTFADIDVGDTLSYSATLGNGDALPSWLSFDAVTRTFSGLPGNADVGSLSLKVTATDGASASVSSTFSVTVDDVNDAPTEITLSANTVAENAANAVVGSFSSSDPDAESTFTYSILPGGDSALFTISGNTLRVGPTALDYEFGATRSITVRSIDQDGLAFDQVFAISVANDVSDDANIVNGTTDADALRGSQDRDVINGGDGDDTLSALEGHDELNGGAGADVLDAGTGNDVLNGGAGNDTMYGGAGDDTYIFGRGYQQDRIQNGDSAIGRQDVIRLAADIAPSDIALSLGNGGKNLVLTIVGTADELTVTGMFNSIAEIRSQSQIEKIFFADGTVWNHAAIAAQLLIGNDLANTISGFETGDVIEGKGGNDLVFGNGGDDLIFGGAGADVLMGGFGSDVLNGGQDNDTLYGQAGHDSLNGDAGSDFLEGHEGDDTLNGGAGDDTMVGSLGNDTYIFGRGFGLDVINNADVTTGKLDVVRLEADVLPEDVNLKRSGANLRLAINSSTDILTIVNFFPSVYAASSKIEQIQFANGTVWDDEMMRTAVLIGDQSTNELRGYDTADKLDGKSGGDFLWGGTGNDILIGGDGADMLYGEADSDILFGDAGADVLTGADGDDILVGGVDNDVLAGGSGNNLMDGCGGDDNLIGDLGNDFLIGGSGNDSLTTGTGHDVIALNRGHGQDLIAASAGADNTLSLGHGIRYADLLLKKASNHLILVTGADEHVTFMNWYAHVDNHSVTNLQIVIESTLDYDVTSSNQLHNKKIVQFDFGGLVSQFDQERLANPALASWALSSSLLSFHLSGSDTSAVGGDLAYQYAKNGNLSEISMSPAQAILASEAFGSAGQNLQQVNALQDLSPRLQ